MDNEVKDKLVELVKESVIACGMDVPCNREILKRVKGFYGNRRSMELLNSDPVKKKKRKMEVKRNRMTYVRVCLSILE